MVQSATRNSGLAIASIYGFAGLGGYLGLHARRSERDGRFCPETSGIDGKGLMDGHFSWMKVAFPIIPLAWRLW